ncbi:Type IV pilus ATPase PilU [Gammaproteobacteria bacterium]
MEFDDYLRLMVSRSASDLYLTTGAPPSIKVDGLMTPVEPTVFPPDRVRSIAYPLMRPDQIETFERRPEMNLAYSLAGAGRFRVNIFKQRNQVAMVVRHIRTVIPSMETLGLPAILTKVIMLKRGLVLVVGATGSGKSTSLASLIDYRNTNSSGHIITIEDPVEFLHPNRRSIVNQREVGIDTESYADALKNTLRQAPDVILIGEIRERETMEHAISFAETGHLCISTLHSNNSNQALDRIINFFSEEKRSQLLMDLSLNLKAVISQRLIPGIHGGRMGAFEVLLASPLISDLIKRGEFDGIKAVMERSEPQGMRTFDGDLYRLYKEGLITQEEALRNADSQNNLRLRINLSENKQTAVPQGLSLAGEINEADMMSLRSIKKKGSL